MITYIKNLSDYRGAMVSIMQRRIMAVDTETTGFDPYTSALLAIQVGNFNQQFIFDYHLLKNAGCDFEELKEYLKDTSKTKILHNAKFDYKMLRHHLGVPIENLYCTFVVEHMLKKGKRLKGFNLAEIAERRVGVDLEKSLRESFPDHIVGTEFTPEQLEYMANDVKYLLDIYESQQEEVRRDPLSIQLADIECRAVSATAEMELNGIYLDPEKWTALFEVSGARLKEAEKDLRQALDTAIKKYQESLYKAALEKEITSLKTKHEKKMAKAASTGKLFEEAPINFRALAQDKVPAVEKFEVNLASSTQMLKLLSLHLGKSIDSTEEEYLKSIDNPIIEKVITYRKAMKLVTTYGAEFLKKAIHPVTGRIHTNFNQTRADSGRYSSSDPVNLQNIPNQEKYRAAFCVQDPSWKMICADYSSCELRLIAEVCNDPIWIDAFNHGKDMHSVVTSMIFKIPYEQIVDEKNKVRPEYKELRNKAKTIGFGLAYGMKAGRLANEIKVSKDEAKALLEAFWKAFPNIQVKLKELGDLAISTGKAVSPLDGRVRHLGSMDFDDRREKSHAESIAKNMAFQSSSATITKLAMALIREGARNKGWDTDKFRLLITVHDEILAEAKEEIAEEARQLVENSMMKAGEVYVKKVHMPAEAVLSDHWVH